MKKIIAFIILVILVILIICLSYNYYKKQDAQRAKVNKLKTDLETSEILDNKNKKDADSDKIEVEEKDTNSSENDSDEKESSKSKEKEKTNDSSKSNKSNDDSSDDDYDDISIDDEDVSEEDTNVNVPDTASNDNNGFVKLNSYSIDLGKFILKVGESTNVIVKYNPSNASVKDTTFVSENKNCKVSSLGKVTGLKKGTCSILVKVKNQNSKSLLLTVK
jgi:hypothetical protein